MAHKLEIRRVLDYGCGDGTLLGLMEATGVLFEEAVGAELSHATVLDCNDRLGTERVKFCQISELEQEQFRSLYDTVFCLEVLEHVVALEAVLDTLDNVLAPGGKLVVSVPVETGPPLIAKQCLRRLSGWRGIGDYRYNSRYSPGDLCRSVFASSDQQIVERPVYASGDLQFHDHKGFNWRLLRSMLQSRLDIESTITSPVPWLPPSMASQVWFVLKKRTAEPLY